MLQAAYRWLTVGPPAFRVRPLLIQLQPLLATAFYKGAVPHLVKQRIIREHARRFGLRTLVETGTYMGDMVWAMRDQFDEIHSIELDPKLYAMVSKRFKRYPHVHLYQGDSAKVLADVLSGLAGPSVFWLDGHYSAGITARGEIETPVLFEISHVFRDPRRGHVILIDDARCFGYRGYPAMAELRALTAKQGGLSFEVDEDVIRIFPKPPAESQRHDGGPAR